MAGWKTGHEAKAADMSVMHLPSRNCTSVDLKGLCRCTDGITRVKITRSYGQGPKRACMQFHLAGRFSCLYCSMPYCLRPMTPAQVPPSITPFSTTSEVGPPIRSQDLATATLHSGPLPPTRPKQPSFPIHFASVGLPSESQYQRLQYWK